jgi:hypothetical protein
MRPLTDSEIRRMQQSTESRLAGVSEVSFHCVAKLAGEEPEYWYETGYMCNARLTNPATEVRGNTSAVGTFGETNYDEQEATFTFPMRYAIDNAFVVKDNENWKGTKFRVSDGDESGWTPDISDVLEPRGYAIRIDKIFNMAPMDNKEFDIVASYGSIDAFTLYGFSREMSEADYLGAVAYWVEPSIGWSRAVPVIGAGGRAVLWYFNGSGRVPPKVRGRIYRRGRVVR